MSEFLSLKTLILSISLIFFGVLLINLSPYPYNYFGLVPILIAFIYPVKSTLLGRDLSKLTTPPCVFLELKKEAKLTNTEMDTINRFIAELNSITPRFGKPEKTDLIIDPIFQTYLFYWLTLCTDTTFYSIRCLDTIGRRDFICDNKKEITEFIMNSRYIKKSGFIIVEKEDPTLYATAMGINTLKVINEIDWTQPLITNGEPTGLNKEKLDTINTLIRTSAKDGYFLDNSTEPESHDLWTLYVTSRILWNLQRKSTLFDMIDSSIIVNFIRDCLKKDEACWGFSYRPETPIRGMSATFYGLDFLDKYKDVSPDVKKLYDEIMENADKFYAFLNRCLSKEDGAFSSLEGGLSALHATWFAMRIKKLLGKKLEDERNGTVVKFVERCRDSTSGGFSLIPGYTPTAYATRWAVEILSMVNMNDSNGWYDGVYRFITERLYDEEEGGFSGVSVENKELRRKLSPHIRDLSSDCPLAKFQLKTIF